MAKKAKVIKEKSIEDRIWDSANKLRGNLTASEYQNVVLGLVFLNISATASISVTTNLLKRATASRKIATNTPQSMCSGCLRMLVGMSSPTRRIHLRLAR